MEHVQQVHIHARGGILFVPQHIAAHVLAEQLVGAVHHQITGMGFRQAVVDGLQEGIKAYLSAAITGSVLKAGVFSGLLRQLVSFTERRKRRTPLRERMVERGKDDEGH
jgi:hypothetical protein